MDENERAARPEIVALAINPEADGCSLAIHYRDGISVLTVHRTEELARAALLDQLDLYVVA